MRRSARLLKQALNQTDERSKLEGEVIGGIDVIKCSAWEVGARGWSDRAGSAPDLHHLCGGNMPR